MKECPWCAEEIQDEARICRYCRRGLDSSDDVRSTADGLVATSSAGLPVAKQRLFVRHRRRVVFGGFLLVALVVAGGVVWAAQPGSLVRVAIDRPKLDGCEAGLAQIQTAGTRWDDEVKVAGQTPRSALAAQISRMQQARRDAAMVSAPSCLGDGVLFAQTTAALLVFMDDTIDEFVGFLGQKPYSSCVSSGAFVAFTDQTRALVAAIEATKAGRELPKTDQISQIPACVSTPTAQPTQRATSIPTPSPTQSPIPLGSAKAYPDGWTITAVGIAEQPPFDYAGFTTAPFGMRLVLVTVKLEYRGQTGVGVADPTDFQLVDGSGQIHRSEVDVRPGALKFYETVRPGGAVTRTLLFKAPATDTDLVLAYSDGGHGALGAIFHAGHATWRLGQ